MVMVGNPRAFIARPRPANRYAGSNQVKQVSAPDEERLLQLDIQLRETYDSLFENRSEDVVDYPANPAPLELFEAGGIHVGTSEDLRKMHRLYSSKHLSEWRKPK